MGRCCYAAHSLHKIKDETADIVHKMKNVSISSDESFKNLTELENVLEEFKTSEERAEAENEAAADESAEEMAVAAEVTTRHLVRAATP